jgi:Domain of unknown function (DUF4262)
MDLQTQAWLDQEDAHTAAMVRRYGWFIQYVLSSRTEPGDGSDRTDGPPFAYTVGLFGLDHAELLIVGVPEGTAAWLLNTLGERIRAGAVLLPGQLVTFDDWPHRIIPEEVPNPDEIVFAANRFYHLPDNYSVPVLLLSYDDKAGRFPWETGYAAPAMQPRPGSFRA